MLLNATTCYHRLGLNFLKLIFDKHQRELPSQIKTIEIKRQYRNSDILAVVDNAIGVRG
jgi:hypothetical protein